MSPYSSSPFVSKVLSAGVGIAGGPAGSRFADVEWALNIVDKCSQPLRSRLLWSSALLFQQGRHLKLDLGRQHFAAVAGLLLERLR